MNNVKNSIGWADFTWNPVTGCIRGCPYCYAKRIHDRFHPDFTFNIIQFHEERLLERMPKKPSKIFVGSMSDIEYWDKEWTEQILEVCRNNPQHTFMFLSKCADSYKDFDWPANTMQGITVTKIDTEKERIETNKMFRYPRPFISIEPLLGNVHSHLIGFELAIVGAMTGPKAVKPKQEWIDLIADYVSAPIYWKSNIRRYLS